MKRLEDSTRAIKKYFKIYKRILALSTMKKMAYPLNLSLIIIALTVGVAITLLFADIIYKKFNGIAGLQYEQILVIIGIAMIVDGCSWMIFWRGLAELPRLIHNGKFDFVLTRPIDTQFSQAITSIDIEDLSKVFVGLFIVIQNTATLEISGISILFFIISMLNSLVIIYSISCIGSCVCFWFVKFEGNWRITNTMLELSKYPTDIYQGMAKLVFTFVFPIAFLATVPAKILTNPFHWSLILGSTLTAIVFFAIARKMWFIGLRKYSSCG